MTKVFPTTYRVKKLLLLFLLVFIANGLSAQSAQEEFGQNRVQYKDFVWSFYKSEHFTAYFYLGGQELGKFTILSAEKEIADVEDKLEYKLNDRVDILIYNNLGDLKQSNIGY